MTKREFGEKYRGAMLLFVTEAWAVRRESPSSLALVLDGHYQRVKDLLGEMYDDLRPPEETPRVAAAGHAGGAANGRKS